MGKYYSNLFSENKNLNDNLSNFINYIFFNIINSIEMNEGNSYFMYFFSSLFKFHTIFKII